MNQKFWSLLIIKGPSYIWNMGSKSGDGACLKKSVPGYARLHKNVTKDDSRFRSATQRRNQGRFSVTLGYTKT